jgi:hypothetical protein
MRTPVFYFRFTQRTPIRTRPMPGDRRTRCRCLSIAALCIARVKDPFVDCWGRVAQRVQFKVPPSLFHGFSCSELQLPASLWQDQLSHEQIRTRESSRVNRLNLLEMALRRLGLGRWALLMLALVLPVDDPEGIASESGTHRDLKKLSAQLDYLPSLPIMNHGLSSGQTTPNAIFCEL